MLATLYRGLVRGLIVRALRLLVLLRALCITLLGLVGAGVRMLAALHLGFMAGLIVAAIVGGICHRVCISPGEGVGHRAIRGAAP